MTRRCPALRRQLLGSLLCTSLMVASASAFAQSSDDDARRHFEAGASYFNASDLEGALREFQQALKLSEPDKRPLILRNLAAVYERMGDLPNAITSLQGYLDGDPATSERATIELRIENLKKRLEAQRESQTKAPPSTPVPAATQHPAKSLGPAPAQTAAPDRTWAYVALGVGALAAGGAVATGFIAQSQYDDKKSTCAKTPQGCSDSDVSPVNTWAWTSTGLTGLAVVGVGVGSVLYFTGGSSSSREQGSLAMPHVLAGVGKSGGAVQASWVF